MLLCFIDRRNKELLVSLKFDNDFKCDGNCHNDNYDVIKIDEDDFKKAVFKDGEKKYLLMDDYDK